MTKLEALIEEARRLPLEDRQSLLAEVEQSLASEPAQGIPTYASLVSLTGTATSE